MRKFRIRHPERLNIKIIGCDIIRIARGHRAVHISIMRIMKIGYSAIAVLLTILFVPAVVYAFAGRAYGAIGGEIIIFAAAVMAAAMACRE
ncbi:hypothetical protein SDC9_146114 [bioreactor metagenome]|uniref:Uncharacterized protein n=1 Tax=bioreactor metagenome TaxID=1076179 RepID=A0A645EA71_9ZZZZ|nr:hypothetical protein [Oscillospiraceae bacterium]